MVNLYIMYKNNNFVAYKLHNIIIKNSRFFLIYIIPINN